MFIIAHYTHQFRFTSMKFMTTYLFKDNQILINVLRFDVHKGTFQKEIGHDPINNVL